MDRRFPFVMELNTATHSAEISTTCVVRLLKSSKKLIVITVLPSSYYIFVGNIFSVFYKKNV